MLTCCNNKSEKKGYNYKSNFKFYGTINEFKDKKYDNDFDNHYKYKLKTNVLISES